MPLQRYLGLSLLCVLATVFVPLRAADQRSTTVTIAPVGGLPVLFADGIRLRWLVPGDVKASSQLQEMLYDEVREDIGTGTRLTLTSRESFDGRQLVHRYEHVHGSAHAWQLDLDLPPGVAVELLGEPGFVPESLPGFGAVYSKVSPVAIAGGDQQLLESAAGASIAQSPNTAAWFGIRNRFQAGLLRADVAVELRVDAARANLPRVIARPDGGGRLQLDLYAGPVESHSLAIVDPNLTGMLYAALWNWLRLLCFGMAWLLTSIVSLVGNIGLSIILLSLSVKLLMLPLTAIADRWQESVNRTTATLQPKIDAIKQQFKGEQAHKRILAAYREHQVSPLYPVKSAAAFLIQIPIFIAAFDMLGQSTLLDSTSFLWIDDLAKPDRALLLPWDLPFFGANLNLLPFLMTAVTLLTSAIQADAALTPGLLRKQRARLYLMAVMFFLLFYTFPAGMVLYWTTNNVLHLSKIMIRGSRSADCQAD